MLDEVRVLQPVRSVPNYADKKARRARGVISAAWPTGCNRPSRCDLHGNQQAINGRLLKLAACSGAIRGLLQQVDEIMLRETQGWSTLMRFVEIRAE